MNVRMTDRRLIAATEEGKANLNGASFTGTSADLRRTAVELLDRIIGDFKPEVEQLDEEGVEASEAKQILDTAEHRLDASFSDLYDGLVITHKHLQLSQPDRDDHSDPLKRYLEGHSGSDFKRLSRADKVTVMNKALTYLDRYTTPNLVPPGVVSRARRCLSDFESAHQSYRDETAEVVDARNALEETRDEAHDNYLAARDALSAAVRLDDGGRSVNDYLPALNRVLYNQKGSAEEEDDSSADADAPSPASPTSDEA